MYFKKNEFFLASNSANYNNNQLICCEDEEVQEQLDRMMQAYPNHMFLTVLTAVRLKDQMMYRQPVISTITVSQK